jgi:hypothetical protein
MGCTGCTKAYELIALPVGSSKDAVKSTRKEWSKNLHPDIWQNRPGGRARRTSSPTIPRHLRTSSRNMLFYICEADRTVWAGIAMKQQLILGDCGAITDSPKQRFVNASYFWILLKAFRSFQSRIESQMRSLVDFDKDRISAPEEKTV